LARTRGDFFRKLFASYLILCAVPFLLVSLLARFYITPEIYRRELDHGSRMLDHIVRSVDLVFNEINKTAFFFSMDRDLQKAVFTEARDDAYFLSQTIDRLSSIKAVNPGLHSVYLVSQTTGKVLHDSEFLLDLAAFYDRGFIEEYFASGEAYTVKSRLLDVPGTATRMAERTRVISVVRRLRDGSGVLVFNIYEKTLREIVGSFLDGSSRVFIVDGTGQAISPLEGRGAPAVEAQERWTRRILAEGPRGQFEVRENGRRTAVSFVKSGANRWIYVDLIDTGSLWAISRRVTWIVGAVSALCLALSVGITRLLARRIYGPMERLLSSVREASPSVESSLDEFRYIHEAIHAMSDGLSASSRMAGELLLQRLLKGEGSGSGTPLPPFRHPDFVVLSVEMDDWAKLTYHLSEREIDGARDFIGREVAAHYAGSGWDATLAGWEQMRLAVIVNCRLAADGGGSMKRVLDVAGEAQKALAGLGSSVTIGIGEAVGNAAEIFKSYFQSRNALDYKMLYGGGQILYIGDLQDRRARGYLDLQRSGPGAEALMEAVIALDPKRITDQFDGTVGMLLSVGADLSYIRVLFLQYVAMLSSIPYRLHVDLEGEFQDVAYGSATSSRTVEQMKEYVAALSVRILGAYEKENGKKDRIVNEVKQYIAENYGDQSISLDFLADKVLISKFHLSRVFKERTGQNYLEFLKAVRIGKAKDLLRTTDLDVQEISRRIGYDTPNSFSRMFKHEAGLSPSEYRNALHAPSGGDGAGGG